MCSDLFYRLLLRIDPVAALAYHREIEKIKRARLRFMAGSVAIDYDALELSKN